MLTWSIVLVAIIALGWALDRRNAQRREFQALDDGVFLGKTIGHLSRQQKDAMFADVMAARHERENELSKKEWDWYMIGWATFCGALAIFTGILWWRIG